MIQFELENIEVCEYVEDFVDEYVYDIEVDDSTHTFIANDILVHNSCYVTFQPLFDTTNYQETKYKDDELSLILDVYEHRLKDYLNNAFIEFAKKRNTTNYQVFELENISRSVLWTSMKHYVKDVAWEEPNIRYKTLENLKYTGIEIIQSSTPSIIRSQLVDIVRYIMATDVIDMDNLIRQLKVIRKIYIEEPNFDIKCKNVKVNNYEKYCVDDTETAKVAFKCPINVRSAIYYNKILYDNKLYDKYQKITSGDKVKFYYTKNVEYPVFSYRNNYFPAEFAPEMDIDVMFEKFVLSSINSFLVACKYPEIAKDLTYKRSLF